MNAVAERIAQLRPADVQGSQGPQIVWLLGPSRDQPPYRVLDSQTLPAVQVSEISEAGSVPELLVENKLDVRVFLMDGQELVGAKQNRILNTDVLVPAGTRLRIPVSCVEAGRWEYASRAFSPGRTASYRVRAGKQQRVHESLRREGRHDADQGAVWDEVAMSLACSGCRSSTGALHDAYLGRREALAEFRSSLRLPDDAVGLAVFDGGEFRGLDIFDRHSTLKYFWESLVDSYSLEWLALGDARPWDPAGPQEAIGGLLARIAAVEWEAFDSPGDGREFRFRRESLAGSALVWEQQSVVHLQVFPADPDATGSADRQAGRARIHRRYRRADGGQRI